MKILGPCGLLLVVPAALMIAEAPAAANPMKGYQVTYVAERDHYCVRPVTGDEAVRLGISLYKTECHSAAAWAQKGLKILRG